MRHLLNKKALTLTELLAATIVTGIVMIGVASMDISLRNAFEGTSKDSIVATRASIAMQHISRRILEASGNSQNLGVACATDPGHLWIRKDTITPSNYDDDTWFLYKQNPTTSTLDYCTTSGSASPDCILTIQTFQNITLFEPTLFDDPDTNQFGVKIKLSSLYSTASAPDDFKNPEYTIVSAFNLPSSSGTAP
jgi:hypothetical protein